ncbi:hypothetical protein MKK53_01895, partial [Methylobacterium sp. J-076]
MSRINGATDPTARLDNRAGTGTDKDARSATAWHTALDDSRDLGLASKGAPPRDTSLAHIAELIHQSVDGHAAHLPVLEDLKGFDALQLLGLREPPMVQFCETEEGQGAPQTTPTIIGPTTPGKDSGKEPGESQGGTDSTGTPETNGGQGSGSSTGASQTNGGQGSDSSTGASQTDGGHGSGASTAASQTNAGQGFGASAGRSPTNDHHGTGVSAAEDERRAEYSSEGPPADEPEPWPPLV